MEMVASSRKTYRLGVQGEQLLLRLDLDRYLGTTVAVKPANDLWVLLHRSLVRTDGGVAALGTHLALAHLDIGHCRGKRRDVMSGVWQRCTPVKQRRERPTL